MRHLYKKISIPSLYRIFLVLFFITFIHISIIAYQISEKVEALAKSCEEYDGRGDALLLLNEAFALEDDEERYEVFWEITQNKHFFEGYLGDIVKEIQEFEYRTRPGNNQYYQTNLLGYIAENYRKGDGSLLIEAIKNFTDHQERYRLYSKMMENEKFFEKHKEEVLKAIQAFEDLVLRNKLLKKTNGNGWCYLT